jgi:hypothetical protein
MLAVDAIARCRPVPAWNPLRWSELRRLIWPTLAWMASLYGTPAWSAEVAKRADQAHKAPVPDLQGLWTGGILTPLERPKQLADTPVFQPDEMAEQQRQATERFWAAGHRPGEVGRDNDAFLEGTMKILPDGRTSLLTQPANGLLPLLPRAEQRRDFNSSNFDAYETMSQFDRCITREPLMMLPALYNSAYQIVQTPTHLMIVAEMVHDVRIIPLDGSKHSDARITSWGGDPRGRWESGTLVVETRNFNGRGWIATSSAAGRLRGVPASAQLRTIERFKRLDATTIEYQLTVEDPQAFSAPWTVTYPLTRDDSYQMFEFACHEGNTAVQAMMRGARAAEQVTSPR